MEYPNHPNLLPKVLIILMFLFGTLQAENSNLTKSTLSTIPTIHKKLTPSTLATTKAPMTATAKPPHTTLPDCRKNQIKYQYTECDALGGRWKIGIPSEVNTCRLKDPPIPERQKQCKISCDTGKYLNIETQKCLPCDAGTYSLNGGVRIESWDKLPSGFETWGRDNDDTSVPVESTENVCNSYKWTTKGQYIESAGDYCKSVLMYSATLIREGNVSITFRANNDMANFHIRVVNNWCSSTKRGLHNYYPILSTSWKTNFIRLKQGRNAIFFEASYVFDQDMTDSGDTYPSSGDGDETSGAKHEYNTKSKYSVQIREIEITGLSYTSECTHCPAGTYSKGGSASCEDCDIDTFSKKGAATCTKCGSDEYAGKGAFSCKKRKPCTKKDYLENWSVCDENNKISKSYAWIKPKICNSDLKESVKLPTGKEQITCPPCNPGQFKNGTTCEFCKKGTFSNGINAACVPCPVSTTPKVGLYFVSWRSARMDLLHPYCISREERSCVTNKGWIAESNHLSSGTGHGDDAELVLYVEIPKFTKENSQLVIEFEMICDGKCRFLLEEFVHSRGILPIMRWHGQRSRTKYLYDIRGKSFRRFKLTFEKPYVSDEQTHTYSLDRIHIYVLNITNAANGGADRCVKCSGGTNQKGCIHCKVGQYLDESKKKCLPCPKNTYWVGNSVEASKCVACPEGSISGEGSTHCYSSCKLTAKDGKEFDFSPLAGAIEMKGEKQFTSRAFPYFHRFNVSVCGSALGASCYEMKKDIYGNTTIIAIHSSICRSYCYSEDNGKLCAQAMSLGEYLQTIRFGDPFQSNKTTGVESLGQADEINDTLPSDVGFFFKSTTITPRCPNGFSTLITMRCDPFAKDKGYLRPPQRCSYGTCNGCFFHLYWHSPFSCPICTYRDYQNITSACVNGKSTTHHVWYFPKMCRDGVQLPSDSPRQCSIFEKSILDFKIFISVFLGLGLLLVCTVLLLCYRNRSLSYKYHRLIDATAVNDGELPAAEKCTLEDGEDDEEGIVLSRNGRAGRRILDRLKKSIGSPMGRDQFSEFETINLTEYGNRLVDDDEEEEH